MTKFCFIESCFFSSFFGLLITYVWLGKIQPLMYSELWNNQRSFSVCEKKKQKTNSGTLQTTLILSRSFSLYYSALLFNSERHSPLNFAQQHLNISWNWHWLQCYRDVVVPDVQYRRAIHIEQSHRKDRPPRLCSICWCHYRGWSFNWASSSFLYHDSLCWLVCSFHTVL